MRNQPKEHTEKSLPKTQTTIQNYINQIAQTHGQTTINTQKDKKKEEEEEDEERPNPRVGFEFDSISNDFKVVRLLNVQFRSASNLLHISQEVEVYSISSGLWRASGIKWEKNKNKKRN